MHEDDQDAPGPTPQEIEEFRRDEVLLGDDREAADPDHYPRLFNISAGPLVQTMIRPQTPQRPEYVTVSLLELERLEKVSMLARWNLLWEAAQFRRRYFDSDELPPAMGRIADQGDNNVVFLPRSRSRYFEYAPLAHLLPKHLLDRFDIPALSPGHWPVVAPAEAVDRYLPENFADRLARAWAAAVWPHLGGRSMMSAFGPRDPIRLLAHNLDFWVPAVTDVIQDILRELPLVERGVVSGPVTLADGSTLPGAVQGNTRMGSDVWQGEFEADEIVADVVDAADETGQLRALLDAVRRGRVEDDFSDRWSWERADFERKLHRRRDKIGVRFVELTDTIPVHGHESEVIDRHLYGDFLALLDERDRQIVVVLRSGTTKLTDVADILGYSNHSAVSKRLIRIRRQAVAFFDQH